MSLFFTAAEQLQGPDLQTLRFEFTLLRPQLLLHTHLLFPHGQRESLRLSALRPNLEDDESKALLLIQPISVLFSSIRLVLLSK